MVDRASGLPIAKEGVPFVLGVGAPALAAGAFGFMGPAVFLAALAAYTAWFFRNPHRVVPLGEDLIVSPGDGKVIAVDNEFEPRFLKEDSIRISIFLNVFNVHINRVPCAGVIRGVGYQSGQFIAANHPNASIRNEQNALMIQRHDGASTQTRYLKALATTDRRPRCTNTAPGPVRPPSWLRQLGWRFRCGRGRRRCGGQLEGARRGALGVQLSRFAGRIGRAAGSNDRPWGRGVRWS